MEVTPERTLMTLAAEKGKQTTSDLTTDVFLFFICASHFYHHC